MEMDYTMDEGQSGQNPPPPARQCQYQPPQQPSTSNPYFPPSSRDAHHYDPVHNTDSWYQNNGPGAQSRPQYTATPNISQWNPGPFVPLTSWQGFGEAQGGTQGHDGSSNRPQTGFMGISNTPWSEMRGYEPLSFGYHGNGYVGSGNNGPSAELNPGRRSAVTASPQIPASQTQQPNLAALQAEYVRRSTHRGTHSESILERGHPEYASRMREAERVADRMRNETPASQSQPSRPYAYGARPARRHLAGWESDDDDDAAPDLDIDSYRRNAEILFADMDDERHMAAVRGAMAAGKKVPSKDFVASLEKLDPKELKEADRTCMICYNEFGVRNPDGILEHPIRLPKCKHVFGDKCIKKWFEDSDSCPYCRDKLPSELSVRKSIALEALQQARRERLQIAAAAGQGHGFVRSRHGFGSVRFPSSDELVNTGLSRHSQEEYHHYIMRGSMPPDPWSQSPPNRPSPRELPENRRRQPRGRVGLGRPTSVGSARFITPNMNHQNAQRAHLQNITPNFQGTTSPRRSTTPGPPRHGNSGSSGPPAPIAHSTVQTPPRNGRLPGPSSTSEEASPPVAIGSGIAAGEQLAPATSLPNRPSTLSEYGNSQWSDPFGAFLNQAEPTYFRPGRPADVRAHVAEAATIPLFETMPTNSDLPPIPMGDLSPRDTIWHEGMAPRWSR